MCPSFYDARMNLNPLALKLNQLKSICSSLSPPKAAECKNRTCSTWRVSFCGWHLTFAWWYVVVGADHHAKIRFELSLTVLEILEIFEIFVHSICTESTWLWGRDQSVVQLDWCRIDGLFDACSSPLFKSDQWQANPLGRSLRALLAPLVWRRARRLLRRRRSEEIHSGSGYPLLIATTVWSCGHPRKSYYR